MRRALLALLLAPGAVLPAQDNAPTAPTLSFHFERAGLAMAEYTFVVHEDGTGSFAGLFAAPATSRYNLTASGPAQPLALSFTLAPATAARLFDQARQAGGFSRGCESKAKNIAATGQKTLTLAGTSPHGSCTYNYTEQKPVASLADAFLAMEYTLEAGEKLKLKHRFDRLGLDAEMKNLTDAAAQGRAQSFELIAQVLRSLVDDVQLMDRVRARARQLLELAATT